MLSLKETTKGSQTDFDGGNRDGGNTNDVQTGVNHLNELDTRGTILWWDISGSNF